MPDVLEADVSEQAESVSVSLESVPKPRDYSHLKAYQFKAGALNPARYDPRAHRPKGVKSAQDAILAAAPKLAKAYIQRAATSDAICIDARKWIMPTDGELANGEAGVPGLTINFGIVAALPASMPATENMSPVQALPPTTPASSPSTLSSPVPPSLPASRTPHE